jgi:predicted Zn-dependent peptidase
MLDRSQAPASLPGFDISIPRAESSINRNTHFHWIIAGKQPVVRIEVIFRKGGSIHDIYQGQGFLTNKMLLHGTSQLTTAAIAEELDRYGAFVRLSPSFDDPSMELYCLTRHLDKVLPTFAQLISDSVFPDDEFDLVQRIAIENLQLQNARNSILATKAFRNRIFGDSHPYGRIMTEEHLAALKSSDLRSFYKERLGTFEVIVSGNYADSEKAKIIEHLSSGPVEDDEEFNFKAESIIGEFYNEKTSSLQTSLRIGHQLPGKGHPDYPKLRVCIHALGGYFGSRLMKNIREDKGYTYGIYASVVTLIHGSYLSIGADVQKQHRQAAIEEVYMEIQRLQNDPLPEEELLMVRNHMLGSFQSELDSPFSLSGKFKAVYLYGLGYDYYDRFIDTVKTVTAEDIRLMAVKYLHYADFTEVSVG